MANHLLGDSPNADFARRLHQAADANPQVPPMNYGRLTWVREHLASRFGQTVALESVRKWFSGDAKPRDAKVKNLAILLEVDEPWLSLGSAPDLDRPSAKRSSANASGAVNIVAGVIQLEGGSVAFPAEDDSRSAMKHIDLYAIIKGAQYAIHVSVGRLVDGNVRFVVPLSHDEVVQIGVLPREGAFEIWLVDLSDEIDAETPKRGGGYEVTMTVAEAQAKRITTFTKRL
jgi:hypothetical protein